MRATGLQLGLHAAPKTLADCHTNVALVNAGSPDASNLLGCTTVRSEKRSGTTREGREELATILEFMRADNTLVVTRIDRLARSVKDLEDILAAIRANGAHLRVTEQPVDTSTAAGVAFLQMLGVFAQFETALRKERQMEGIAKAKAADVYRGRKPSVPIEDVRRLHEAGAGASVIAKQLKIGRASVYRALNKTA